MIKDTLVVPISDLHIGSTVALFPDGIRYFKHGNHTPSSLQKRIFDHWMFCAEKVKEARKGKKLIIVVDGDSIDGVHNGTHQLVTSLINEQIALHIEIMKAFMGVAGFVKTDDIYYVTGTEVHVEDSEDDIGRMMGAVPDYNVHAWDELKLEVNGRMLYFVHHGPTAGKGANKGNGLRNWLRNMFIECIQEGLNPPDCIITGHTHDPWCDTYTGRVDGNYRKLHGIICPAWQSKTRYAFRVAPLAQNKIGLQYFTITKDGMISDPVEWIMK